MSPEKRTLDDVIRDSKELLGPDLVGAKVDWDGIESRLMARVKSESRATGGLVRFAGRRSLWGGVAAALAIAASVPMFVSRGAETPFDKVAVESRADRSAGALAWKEGSGEVRVGPASSPLAAVGAGSALERGDAAEAHQAKGFFQRENKVTWALEDASRVRVAGTRGPLVLALERGAVEAQVTPVATGEAFAVDVEGVRVAVHGTHLRVSREGTHVVVDLTEGIVSIGAPPRVGSTYGQLVNAPAHIEFDANDPKGTLKVTHDPARVRAAMAMRPPAETVATVPPRAAIAYEPPARAPLGAAPPAANPGSHLAPPSPNVVPPPAPAPSAAPHVAVVDPHPEQTIANAVRACAQGEAGTHPTDLVITVSSKLVLRVADDGTVENARFEPPLAPEVQSCASKAIYEARFKTPGPLTIPLDFQR
jgi:hypothetical protein